jgi:hypothetical protein
VNIRQRCRRLPARGSLFLYCFSLLLGAVAARADAPKSAAVPLEILPSKHLAVQVKINGKGPYRLIFDTGAPFSIINLRTARASGMVGKGGLPWLTLFNAIGAKPIKRFEVGAVTVENTDAAVMDHPTVELIGKALGPIDGLVGFPFFARFRTTIDYQAKQMTLTPSGYAAPGTDAVVEALIETITEDNPQARLLAPAGQWGLVPAKAKGDEAAGVTVKDVLAGGAAAAAGLKAGDRLLTLDGRWTDSVADAYRAAGQIQPGRAAQAVIKRGDRTLTLTITPRNGL